jgi:transcriptional regulator with XRE-family HTH domain
MCRMDDVERLGEYIAAARTRLRLTQQQLAEQLDVSVKTVNNLEKGRTGPPRPGTRSKLEDTLGWTTGSVRAVLAGGEPTVTEENPRPEGEIDRGSVGSRQQDAEYVAHRHPDDPPAGGLSDEEVLALIRENRRLADELERRIRGGSAGPMDGAT